MNTAADYEDAIAALTQQITIAGNERDFVGGRRLTQQLAALIAEYEDKAIGLTEARDQSRADVAGLAAIATLSERALSRFSNYAQALRAAEADAAQDEQAYEDFFRGPKRQ